MTSKNANTLIVGEDLLAVDIAAARYMGFDPAKVRYLQYFFSEGDISEEDIAVIENKNPVENFFTNATRYKDFQVMELWEETKYKSK